MRFNHPRDWFSHKLYGRPQTWEGLVALALFFVAIWLITYFHVGE